MVGLTALGVAWFVFVLVASVANPSFGLDYRWHMDAARRLLDTGTPYWSWQIAGPYSIGNGAILYPPTAFLLFAPFLWLPAVLWWAVPIAITLVAMSRHRPPLWAWPLTALLFGLEKSLNVYVFGNPSMWIVAAVAAGTAWGWPAVFVLMKPTFAPLALIGIRRRSWWVALGLLGAASVAFGPVWLDWLAVARNSDVSWAYNLSTVPLLVAPLVPWVAVKVRVQSGRIAPGMHDLRPRARPAGA
jgi:hypothetical protein